MAWQEASTQDGQAEQVSGSDWEPPPVQIARQVHNEGAEGGKARKPSQQSSVKID